MSWPAGLPNWSSVAVTSSRSSTIWNTMPNDSPYSVSASTNERSRPATMAPMRAEVEYSDAVLPAMEARYELSGRATL